MNKIGVFYGSTTGTTEDLARRIAEKLDVPSAHIYDVSKLTEALVGEYENFKEMRSVSQICSLVRLW